MSGVGTKRIHFSEEFRTSIIAVDEYDSVNFCGKLYNPFLKQSVEVKSFQHLIKEIDTLMDEIGCPMSGMEKRSFKKRTQSDERETHIRIQYRNNASWQGTVKWIEGEAEECFRSMLELFWLLDSALERD